MKELIENIGIVEAYKNALRPQTEEERTLLKQSMEEFGQLEPLILYHGDCIDGFSRMNIAKELGWSSLEINEIKTTFKDDNEVILWIHEHQKARRNLTKEQRDQLILKKYGEKKEELGDRRGNPQLTSSEVNSEDTDIKGKATSEIVAEELKKEGVDVSKTTVERVVSKDKDPEKKKEFVPKPTFKVCVIFKRASKSSWEAVKYLFPNKKKAEEFVKEEREDGNPMFDTEVAYFIADVPFFTAYDQNAFIRASES